MSVATKVLLKDQFTAPAANWSVVNEDAITSTGRVDHENVIGRVQGPFFLVDGESLNGRFYSRSLWQRQLESKSKQLEAGMLGVSGHDRPIDEDALATGMISHRVTKLWIENNTGMGEIEIFGTPAGRNIFTLLKAGVPLAVSSRAYGSFTGEKSMTGADIIDEKTFDLIGFDWVLNPGVPSARPQLVENKAHSEETVMDEKLQERLFEEKNQLQAKLSEALLANKNLKKVSEKKTAELAKYKKFAKLVLNKIGSIAEIKEAAKSSKGSALSAGKAAAKKLAEFIALGPSPKALMDKLAALQAYEEKVGAVTDFEKVEAIYKAYAALGTPEAIKEKLEQFEKLTARIVTAKQKSEVKKFAEEFKVSEDQALELIKKGLKVADAKEILSALSESQSLTDRYLVTEESKKEKKTTLKAPGNGAASIAARLFDGL